MDSVICKIKEISTKKFFFQRFHFFISVAFKQERKVSLTINRKTFQQLHFLNATTKMQTQLKKFTESILLVANKFKSVIR